MTNPQNDTRGWARPWAIAKPFSNPTPRAGGWYPIVGEADTTRFVIEIRGKRVAILKRLLETRKERPTRFTVVYRGRADENPVRGTARDFGRTYGVCPMCGTRVGLSPNIALAICGECGHRGEVAWWETG